MEWIKRNLGFVIGAGIAIILMGVAGYFLYTKIDQNQALNTQLESEVRELTRLNSMPVHPGNDTIDNVATTREQTAQVNTLLNTARSLFVAIDPFEKTDDKGFKSTLELTISYLQQKATNAGITLPTGNKGQTGPYAFTFAAHRFPLQYPEGNIEGWLMQLSEIKSICDILFEAKINALEGIRRVTLSPRYDIIGSPDFLPTSVPVVSNTVATITPYEITFRGFSSEIGAVMRGLTTASNCFVVKSIQVDRSNYIPPAPQQTAGPTTTSPSGGPPRALPVRTMTAEDKFADRYGFKPDSNPYAPRPSQVVVPAPGAATNAAPVTVLAEKPLRVTMLIEVVRLNASTRLAAK